MFSSFEGKVVLVLGAGATGASIVRWLTLNGATVVLADSRENFQVLACCKENFQKLLFDLAHFLTSFSRESIWLFPVLESHWGHFL